MAAPGFFLREARPRDAEEILRLVRALGEYEKLGHEVVASAQDYYGALATKRIKGMLAEVEGEIVGLALYYETFSTFAGKAGLWVEDVFVQPEQRRLGIGRALFQALARKALDEGHAWMEWNVLDWNEPAIAFYRRIGAVGREEWTDQRLSGDALRALAG
ncbi:GNAT family N-acetyltransferase [Pseudoroseomonas cervicalis]|uniref:Acetyltransferase, GNAT family n=1 Tax=Pseudoroseomonas cervicalis ATCC 49957 TaxID=525371 RepID=D5RPF8_9PROT|nr:GNAT family N-acetyltransferase [Pseudoroseomonas cervicalis]EFH10819.1 acetyltransferase, GNAT family [Pseudoroseomonas cervicalis ATCC 49957]